MRCEREVLKQILDFAVLDDNVRTVIMNGSRVNKNAPEDILRDYDIVFYIFNIRDNSYKNDQSWILNFGELVMLQQNDCEDGSYVFLMQFKDGVRIDLSFQNITLVEEDLKKDSLSKLLLDKDGFFKDFPQANDTTYYVTQPSSVEFDKLLNEAWWIQTYIAKGLWRDELPYVKYMFDVILIDCIIKLISWKIGSDNLWKVNVGKCGKWLKNLMSDDLYNELVSIYPNTDKSQIWDKLFKAGQFIRKIGIPLADKLGFQYPLQNDTNVSEYLFMLQNLPKIRKADNDDTKQIMDLFQSVIAHLDEQKIYQWDDTYPNKKVIKEDLSESALYVYETNGKILGLITLNEKQDTEYNDVSWDYTNGNILVIHRLCVNPSYQKTGIGQKLIEFAEGFAKNNGYSIIRLDAFTANIAACKIYEKNCYHHAGCVNFRMGNFNCYEKQI